MRLEHIVKSYGKREVLRGIDLFAEEGKITAVLGESGAGKTEATKQCLGFIAEVVGGGVGEN